LGGEATLYEAIGGEAVVGAVVDQFYLRVLGNARLAAYFAETGIDGLRAHQRDFLTMLLHGPGHYRGRPLREAHAGRGITDADFDRICRHLEDAFRAAGVAEPLIARALAEVTPLRAQIVGA